MDGTVGVKVRSRTEFLFRFFFKGFPMERGRRLSSIVGECRVGVERARGGVCVRGVPESILLAKRLTSSRSDAASPRPLLFPTIPTRTVDVHGEAFQLVDLALRGEPNDTPDVVSQGCR